MIRLQLTILPRESTRERCIQTASTLSQKKGSRLNREREWKRAIKIHEDDPSTCEARR